MAESLNSHPCTEATIAMIYETFDGITRDGGVSWSETVVLDGYGSPAECAAARQADVDASWQELVDDANWIPDCGIGGFSFLDAVGFRYYLAPAMVRQLRDIYDCDVFPFHLTLGDGELREYNLNQWSFLQQREIQCVCEFLKCMLAVHRAAAHGHPDLYEWSTQDWEQAYYGHWVTVDESPLSQS